MPTFDVETFVKQQVNIAGSTEYFLVPEKNDVRMMVGSGPVEKWFRSFDSDGRSFMTIEIPMLLLDDEIKESAGREVVTYRYKAFVDHDDNGNWDFGKGRNVKIGQLREALGQNDPNTPWSAGMLADQGPILGRITHTDGKDGRKYAEVSRVTAI